MECDCAFWWPFFKGAMLGVMLALTPSFIVLAILLSRSDDDDGPTRGI